jgi:hypothetical protein
VGGVRTVVLDPQPAEVQELLERRKRLDLYDEVWVGTNHLSPAAHPHGGYLDDQ